MYRHNFQDILINLNWLKYSKHDLDFLLFYDQHSLVQRDIIIKLKFSELRMSVVKRV